MPSYTAKCKKCNSTFEYYASIAARNSEVQCECGGSAERDVEAELNRKNVNVSYGEHSREMRSMAVLDEDFAAARKLHPQADWVKRGHSWVPIVKNRTERQRLLRQANTCRSDIQFD